MERPLFLMCFKNQKRWFSLIILDWIMFLGLAIFHFILDFCWKFVTCPFHCGSQVNTRLLFRFLYFLICQEQTLDSSLRSWYSLTHTEIHTDLIEVLSVLHTLGTEKKSNWLLGSGDLKLRNCRIPTLNLRNVQY